MTTEKATPPGIALDNEALDKLEALARAATPGPWSWWTSNSTLRLTGADGRDGGVLYGYVHAGDGDVYCSDANQAFIAAANPAMFTTLVAQARAAQPQPSAAPDGWQWAPIEPTEGMVHAGEDVPAPRPFAKVYRAMLAAAPSPNFAARKAESAGMQMAGQSIDTPHFRAFLERTGFTLPDKRVDALIVHIDIQLSEMTAHFLAVQDQCEHYRKQSQDLHAQLSAARQVGKHMFDALAASQPTAAPTPQAALAEMEARKDAAYLERNQVVAALAKRFPSGTAKTAIEGWSEDWHGCVYIDLPTGQVSWHFHDSQAYLFDGLPQYVGKWDGHDTTEKYRRVAALAPTPHEQEARAAVQVLPGCLADRLYEAIDIARSRASHAGSTTRRKKWEATAADLRAALAAQAGMLPVAQTDAARDVLAERRRQVDVEGRLSIHDDQYVQGQLAQAAACYAVQGEYHFPENWPWSLTWWKPKDQRRNLVKAGALILADIERLDRVKGAAGLKGGAA